MILDVYPWVSTPGRLVNPMAARTFTGFPKEMIANLAQILETNVFRILLHS
jgi:hypothetical protein